MTPQQALDAVRGAAQGQTPNSPQPSQQILNPAVTPLARDMTATSNLEAMYSARISHPMHQFGYDLIANGGTVTSVLNGAIQDSYILGPGDQIQLTLLGQQDATYVARVDRDGQVVFPSLPPIPASGRPFGDFRADLEAAVKRGFVQTRAYVSIGEIRQLTVRVVGEVSNPGVYAVTGLSTVLDALNLAGGVSKTGSLRDITIVRGDRTFKIDLYSMLLTHGRTPDITITQNDRIIVPPIGSTVAITGDVRRPAIYELPRGSSAISMRELVELGNGPQMRGIYREMILRIRPDGKEELSDASNMPNASLRDGEVLYVYKSVNVSMGSIKLVGSVRLPGEYALDRVKTLHDLLPSAEVLAPVPYMLLGVVERTDPKTLQRILLPFSLLHVLQGRENLSLMSGDVVHVLTVAEMRGFAAQLTTADQNSPWTQGQTQTGQTGQSGANLGMTSPPGTTTPGTTAAPNGTVSAAGTTNASGSPAAGVDTGLDTLSADDASFFGHVLGDYRVTLTGAVRGQGVYLVSPGTTLDEVIAAAGGLDSDVDVSEFEITSSLIDNTSGRSNTVRQIYHTRPADFHTIALQPLDAISFHHVYSDRTDGTVAISGEVRYPGGYNIVRGERLSQVLVRAGGLTAYAYPYGTVFLRKSVATVERQGYERVADEVQRQMMVGLTRGGGGAGASAAAAAASPIAYEAVQGFITDLKNQKALGRVSIIADPSVLAAHPDRDPMLEPDDTIYIPQRPSTVTVLGDVMQPGNYEFDVHKDASDYIEIAGGFGDNAEKDLTYIVYPDGTAQRLEQSWLRFNSQGVPPGSVIYVPRDLFPIDWLVLTTSIADLVKDMALSIASLSVLTKNN